MDGWTTVMAAKDLPEGKAITATLGELTLMLFRLADRVFAVSNRCTHQGAPLNRGPVRSNDPVPTVTCPAHGSVFSLSDGKVRRGPATAPLRSFEARLSVDGVEVRPRDHEGEDSAGIAPIRPAR